MLARIAPAGLVVWVASTARSRRSASSRSVRASTRAAWENAGRVLWALVTSASAPCASACLGRSGWKPKCPAHAASTTRGTSCSCTPVGDGGEVRTGADVRRVAEEDRARLGVPAQEAGDVVGVGAEREPGVRVQPRAQPDRHQPGEDEAHQQRTVRRPRHDDVVTRLRDRQRERLVAVGGPAHREPADVGSPQVGRPRLGVGEDAAFDLDGVETAVQGDVAGHDRPDQVGALLVPGDGERRRPRLQEAEVGVEQRGVGPESSWVGRHPSRLGQPVPAGRSRLLRRAEPRRAPRGPTARAPGQGRAPYDVEREGVSRSSWPGPSWPRPSWWSPSWPSSWWPACGSPGHGRASRPAARRRARA